MTGQLLAAGQARRQRNWRSRLVVGLVFLLCLGASAALIWRMEVQRAASARERANFLAQSHAQVLQRNVERMLSLNYALAALVQQGDGQVGDFERAAAELLMSGPRAVAVSLSPAGVVRHVMPRQGNERLLGFDVLNDPVQKADAIFARDTGRLGLAGPIQLVQGGVGFVSRLPVFLAGSAPGTRFWGFSNVTLRQSDLLGGAALPDLLTNGYHYELWQLRTDSGRKEVITSSMGGALERPVRVSLAVPNGAWNLDMAPIEGWSDTPRTALSALAGVVASLVLASLAHMLMRLRRSRAVLEAQVEHRTAEILAAQNQLRSTLEAIQDPIFELDLEGRFHRCSASVESLLPAPREKLLGRTVHEVLPPEAARVMVEALAAAHADGYSQGEQYSLMLEGGRCWFELSVARKAVAEGAPPRFVVMTRDITGRKSAKQEIHRLAFYDPLTDLPNRRLLQDRLEHALATSSRNKHQGALFLIDMDNFKALNDTMGHDKGDQLLQQVARRLLDCVRDSDTVARLGGDEFVLMIDDVGATAQDAMANATTVANKTVLALARPYDIAGQEHRSSSSIGVSLFGDGVTSVEEAFKRSDVAMYQAKAAGRNTVRFFDPQMQAAVEARAALELDLRQAVSNHELELHYQPQVGPQGVVVGAEALLRWQHPVRGRVSPGEFIPVAEHSGLVLGIGEWVLRTACRTLAEWARDPHSAALTLAVNVSVHQFRQPDFVAQVIAALQDAGADAKRLKLEITESMFAVNLEDIIAKMTALQQHGVGFSLDDFGTGYSSLSYLKRLPLDQLKIDQSFVRDVLTDPNDAAIARTIVALGQSLNLAVIAEGVETPGQHAFLLENGCHFCQGYLFSRPLPAAAFKTYLAHASAGAVSA